MIALVASPVCHACGQGEDACECVVCCDFCRRDAWRDEVQRVDHLFLSLFYRCLDCSPRSQREDD